MYFPTCSLYRFFLGFVCDTEFLSFQWTQEVFSFNGCWIWSLSLTNGGWVTQKILINSLQMNKKSCELRCELKCKHEWVVIGRTGKKIRGKSLYLNIKPKRGKERLYMIKTCRTPIEGGGWMFQCFTTHYVNNNTQILQYT